MDFALVRADNPGPLTLSGTNTWLLGRDPCWVVDPGPASDAHLAAVVREARARGGAAGVALTHYHADHSDGAPALAQALGDVPVAARAFAGATLVLGDGDRFGPLEVVTTSGHAPDHLAFVAGDVCCTGDAVLGEGSVFVSADLAAYLEALERLRDRGLRVLLPGHGPPVEDPHAKLTEYLAHRRDRERRLLAALDAGARTVDELLDAAWDDAPAVLRPAAAVTLGAHLAKLEAEGRLPAGVQWPGRG